MPGQQHIAMDTAPELFVTEVLAFKKMNCHVHLTDHWSGPWILVDQRKARILREVEATADSCSHSCRAEA